MNLSCYFNLVMVWGTNEVIQHVSTLLFVNPACVGYMRVVEYFDIDVTKH